MKLKRIASSVAAMALVTAPIAASANPAARLSVASSARAGSAVGDESRLAAPGSVVGLILAALVVAGGIYLVIDDDDEGPDSN